MPAPLSLVILLQPLRPASGANPLSAARPFVTKEMLNMGQTVNPDPFHPKYVVFFLFLVYLCHQDIIAGFGRQLSDKAVILFFLLCPLTSPRSNLRLKFYPSPSNSLSICGLRVHMPGGQGVIRSGNVTFVLGAVYLSQLIA